MSTLFHHKEAGGWEKSWPENTYSKKKKLHSDIDPKREYWQKPQDFVLSAATKMKQVLVLIRSYETNQKQTDWRILTLDAYCHTSSVQKGQKRSPGSYKVHKEMNNEHFFKS